MIGTICTVILKAATLLFGTVVFVRFLLHRHRKSVMTRWAYDRLQGQVVLVTGASSGLGEELARVFYQHGSKVILASRRREELERVKRDLLQMDPKPQVTTHEPQVAVLDLGTEDVEQLQKTAEEIVQIHGRVDILCNNAGISSRANAMDTKIEVDRQIMLVNYLNQIALTKVVLRSLVQKREDTIQPGHIVVISSVQGRVALPNRSSYGASKHAVQAFYDSLRAELTTLDQASHRQVDVSVITAGYIRTNLSLNALNSDGTKYARMDKTTESGLLPSVVAERVVEAVINREPDLVLAPFAPKAIIIIRAIWPWLYFFIMGIYAKKK